MSPGILTPHTTPQISGGMVPFPGQNNVIFLLTTHALSLRSHCPLFLFPLLFFHRRPPHCYCCCCCCCAVLLFITDSGGWLSHHQIDRSRYIYVLNTKQEQKHSVFFSFFFFFLFTYKNWVISMCYQAIVQDSRMEARGTLLSRKR